MNNQVDRDLRARWLKPRGSTAIFMERNHRNGDFQSLNIKSRAPPGTPLARRMNPPSQSLRRGKVAAVSQSEKPILALNGYPVTVFEC